MEYTKGEWTVYNSQRDGLGDWMMMADNHAIGRFVGFLKTEENLANANLIASAPDLYEALRSLVNRLAFYLQNTELELRRIMGGDYAHLIKEYNDTLKALAKAEGKDES